MPLCEKGNDPIDSSTIDSLCAAFDNTLTSTPDVQKYKDAINTIFQLRQKSESGKMPADLTNSEALKDRQKIEEILTRSYQDHSESRVHLSKLIQNDIPFALNLFEILSRSSIHVFVGCFSNKDATIALLNELQIRIHYGEDTHVTYLLSIVLQLLNKFKYNFKEVRFLVKELILRISEDEVKSMMLIIFAELQSSFQKDFDKAVVDFMSSLIVEAEIDVGNDPLSIIVKTLSELYPSLTTLCSEIFLTNGLSKLFKKRVFEEQDLQFTKELLRLLSSACIDETMRTYITENYLQLLERSLNVEDVQIYSALVLVKTWSFTKLTCINLKQLSEIFINAISRRIMPKIENVNESAVKLEEVPKVEMSVEALAYLSLKASVKIMIRSNESFTEILLTMIKSQKMTHCLYGLLVIMANLSTLPEESNGSSQSINDLKNYADLKGPGADKVGAEKESKEDILLFNEEYILRTELISFLKREMHNLSPNCKQQVVRVIYNITRSKNFIPQCISQGGTTIILEYLANKQDIGEPIRILGCRALTRMLIFTNPGLIFKKYSALNAIPFLFELLPRSTPVDDNPLHNDEQIKLTDNYEALLALTNLASSETSDGEEVCKHIVSTKVYWSTIENLMLDENVPLQRSTLELISNMMSHPLTIAAKFFNLENPQSLRNFNILVKLLQLSDVESQRAVAAIFANIATTIPLIAKELLTKKELIENAIQVFADQIDDIELRQRLLMLFFGLFEVIPDNGTNEVYPLLQENQKLKDALNMSLKRGDSGPEFSAAIPVILAKIKV
ncbi:CLL_collapsed_G0049800.mRNA.1.CDS.1 [Saccharomyces cerevisiae]|uniref:K7_She4p n=1 Tax=Saccharomyces cerevisiae (strain Kyokai no. 7 / NBRC 101557) TaxID=721032 RepID=G2WMR7_YEASK|nr:K7_She4p [Saccharomyces cerevisiae Kyokai no. 7]CAI5320348.1 CLL_HP2_G0043240.mRNA.1.CDS.1 [Saccharomyces cerevisiae]CAI6725722.1 CLL_HP2_G0043240.mRNA.1.CDS.1 [Saccharomyces cerevisiae]CAI6772998.1 CLL_HP1_G0048910.mRNA.1.CDS.1 [Saccharomyces cerevisiae]CAI7460809.1 CLL_collapsed_G0049800.mRNA.1.CDS.1 [Saccharomyces cerevisiae]